MSTSDLISEIERHAQERGIAPATVTSRAVGNSRLYHRLKSGGDCTMTIAERLRAFMATDNTTDTTETNEAAK